MPILFFMRKNWPKGPFWHNRAVKVAHQRGAAAARSESTEDHLERIQELVQRKGYARVSDIAVSLGLSRSAVSNMVRRLAARGYVNYEKYRGFTLTEEGRAVAEHVKARHETFTGYCSFWGWNRNGGRGGGDDRTPFAARDVARF